MSTTAAFMQGKGRGAKFLFAQYHDGYYEGKFNDHNGVPKELLQSTDLVQFRRLLTKHSETIEAGQKTEGGDENCLKAVKGFEYIYAFFDGHVWITQGQNWFNPYIPKRKWPKFLPPTTILRKGLVSGHVQLTCGKCGNAKHESIEKIIRWTNRLGGRTLTEYISDQMGFSRSPKQGYLCRRCQPK